MLEDFIKRNSPKAVRCLADSFRCAIVRNPESFVVEILLGIGQICGISCIRRAFAVDENTFARFLIENEKSVDYTVAPHSHIIGVLLNKIIIIQQVVRKILPRIVVQRFQGNQSEFLYVNFGILSFKFDFSVIVRNDSPPKNS